MTPTDNPLVASYEVTPQSAGLVSVEFGKDTTYGLSTSAQTAVQGVPVTILVAGMEANTHYHMRATVTKENGEKSVHADHTFLTGSIPANFLPSVTTQTSAGFAPQPGIELVDAQFTAFATDLDGNVIWYYPFPDRQPNLDLYPLRLLPNGHLGCFIAPVSQSIATNPITPIPAGSLDVLREFDLAGNTVRQLTMAQLNARMAAAGFDVTLQLFSHDFQVLPNGHWLIIANTFRTFTNLVGYPGTTDVTGDVVVDLDTNLNPVWYWSEFDHFDVNRHPMGFPDWTHSNGLAYSPDDGNFLVSIRHQNWVVKVDYRNGAGTGDVLWKLGEGGDFKLLNAVDPTDWIYAQHAPVFTSSNTTGSFHLALMDNGDDREFPAGVVCGSANAPPCLYTTIPVMQVNEGDMTASFLFHQVLPPSLYSAFAGNTEVLANTNIEYNLADAPGGAAIYEVTAQATPETCVADASTTSLLSSVSLAKFISRSAMVARASHLVAAEAILCCRDKPAHCRG